MVQPVPRAREEVNPPFNPLPGPGSFAEKRETGFHAGVVEETADRDAAPHLGPPIALDEFRDDGL